MIIEKNKVVSLTYDLAVKGNTIESVTDIQPLKIIFGTGTLLPKFEENIAGLKVGDKFNFDIKKDEAYGDFREDNVVELPKNIFEVDGKINEDVVAVGKTVPMLDNQGNRLTGIVLEISDETVKMDFNHPLAGDDLSFKGEVIDIREATEEELNAGLQNSGCGCGCDEQETCNPDEKEDNCGCGCGC